MKQINTATLGVRKKVEIDGHLYVVRKMGAGESLALNQTQRRLEALSKKEKAKTITESEQNELLSIGSGFIDAMTSLFDDSEGGHKAKQLISILSPEEITLLMKEIWRDDAVKADAPASS